MDPEIHPNALKHLTLDEVLKAWGSVTKSVCRGFRDEPPRWLCLGWLPDGRSVELVAVEHLGGWLIIHALAPVQPKFAREIEQVERGMR